MLAQARPRVRDEPDRGPLDRRPGLHEVLDERAPEALEVGDVVLGREHVDAVAHRVGGDQGAVVAVAVGGVEVAVEHDVDRHVGQLVAALAAHDLHQPDLGLAVVALAEDEGHASAPSVGAVAERAEQQRDVVVLVGGDGEDDGHLGVEGGLRRDRGSRRRCRRSGGSGPASSADPSATRSRRRPSASVAPRPSSRQPSSRRALEHDRHAGGRAPARGVEDVRGDHRSSSSRRSRAILAISPRAVSSSSSGSRPRRSSPQARIEAFVCSRTQTTSGKPKRSR